ncbi:MAG TPA: glutathione-disulfide reductase [Steroidobacteraceae bacterium]|jgi:glutathione reductase (NADPH)|nr:glutathione-disulfide reductase [Steroidobacteraceae bacterium]
MKHDYDLFVIGAGSGGVRAARIAAQAGARVAIAEEYRIGGTCVIRGCVPKKFLVYGAEFSQMLADAPGYGWTVGNASFDWPTLRDNVQNEVTRLSGLYATNLARAGVTAFEERAELVDAHTVKLGKSGSQLTADRILVATGGRPYLPEGLPGLELGITSNEAFLLEKLPERVLIVGGGYVALEFANIFHGLGSKVRILHRGDKLLRGFDDDLRTHMHIEVERGGTRLTMKATLTKLEKAGSAIRATLSTGENVEADAVLYAIGRDPNTPGLGLERAGVKLDEAGAVIVDEFSQSCVASIYAIGDVTNRMNLTPVAIRDGQAFADSIYNQRPTAVDHSFVPSAVFGRPPIGTVGLSESDARRSYDTVDIYRTSFRPMRNMLTSNLERTLMKIVVDGKSGKLLGVHIAGEDAPEMIQLAAVAVKAGLTKQQWDSTMALHPTAAEELVLLREKVAFPPSLA